MQECEMDGKHWTDVENKKNDKNRGTLTNLIYKGDKAVTWAGEQLG